MGILDIFRRKKKKRFFVRLTGRGGKQLLLGELEASSMDELINEIMKKIENLGETVKQFNVIRIVDMSTNQEVKIKNPLYDHTLDSPHGRSTKSDDYSAIMNELMMKSMTTAVATASKMSGVVMAKMMEGLSDGIKELVKALVSGFSFMKNPQELMKEGKKKEEISFSDIVKLTENIKWMIENRDKVEKALKEGWEAYKEMKQREGGESNVGNNSTTENGK